ncbi:MAG: radical SAM family heme chaperone HemW [Planctomycetota bacterium]
MDARSTNWGFNSENGRCHYNASPGLYVHVPFCRSRCTYCDFHVAAMRPTVMVDYIEALKSEIDQVANSGFIPKTIFIGGGTPSALPQEQWNQLLEALAESFSDSLVEWTIEANPESINPQKIKAALQAGVDRFSTGAQTFSEKGLSLMGRRHNAQRVVEVHRWFEELGVPRTSLDLIVGWPGQDLESIDSDLAAVEQIDPDHISLYHLSYESGTWLHAMRERGGLKPLLDDTCIKFSNAFLSGFRLQGYRRYEVSNLEKRGGVSWHNLNYWQRGEYWGIGSGAASFIEGQRWKNKPDVGAYIAAGGSPERIDLEKSGELDIVVELIMLQLRLSSGLDLNHFRNLTKHRFKDLCKGSLRNFTEKGFLTEEAGHVRATQRGFDVLDSMILQFVEDAEKRLNART